MWVSFEIIPNFLIGHIIHSKKMPGIITNKGVVLGEIRNLLLIEEF